ncbi:uncharacterized protein P174DRAFT_419846 [Aspergillus novofumigatus IBT 16806]|uniref:Uncharacterized protein n=1 Tax=Aspergillus novofumigatus (strain IBT 16806) TaxID=1392255 RepID=A0A2I1CEA4_ASPN1|nr:uncharacterized protein P174DRAFT_419846 [Aspergillus novofumigatus IBT 16806]PKX95950.1 hypothetical protein P174DRAFT_419846 [Aspergillus novofumigatus IBT 16806]
MDFSLRHHHPLDILLLLYSLLYLFEPRFTTTPHILYNFLTSSFTSLLQSSTGPTAYHDPSAPHLVPVDDCLTYETGYRPNLPGQRTWWIFCPITGLFANSYSLLGAMIECVARGQATLAPNWDRTVAGGIWYDFDCGADVLDGQVLMDMAVSDMQRRIERYMYTSDGQVGYKPALGFR